MNLKRRNARRRRTRSHFLTETLEQKCMLTGIAWGNAPDLGISFAPDGTDVAGYTNELHSAFNAVASEAEWKSAIESAFATWTQYIDASTHTVPDSGDAFGITGAAYGDLRFGEVRIAAISGGPNYYAFGIPHNEFVSGTWSGDIVFNSDGPFDSLTDIYAVALHEAGHVFGLEHSDDPNSPMFEHGIPTSVIPTEADIATLQSLYGSPKQLNEPSRVQVEYPWEDISNDLFAGAVTLNPTRGFQHGRYSLDGAIREPGDVDVYRFEGHRQWQSGSGVTNIIIRSKSRGRLVPKATLFDSRGREVPTSVLQSGNGTLVLQSKNINHRMDYFLRIESANGDGPTATGDYSLIVASQTKKSQPMQLVKDTLTDSQREIRHRLFVGHAQLLSLLLSVEETSVDGAVGLAVHDSDGTLLASVSTGFGGDRSLPSLLLRGGTYYITVKAESSDTLSNTKFEVKGTRVDRHDGPLLSDPTADPAFPCEHDAETFCYDDGTVTNNPTHAGPGVGEDPPAFQLFAIHDQENWWED